MIEPHEEEDRSLNTLQSRSRWGKGIALGRRGRLGWKENTEKPIGRFLVGAKFPGMVRGQRNKPLQRIFRGCA
jgi:hypothetical protein